MHRSSSVTGYMPTGEAEFAKCGVVGSQSIGDHGRRPEPPFQETPHEFQCRLAISFRLSEEGHHFNLIDGAPEIVDSSADPDEDLIEMPAT